MMEGIVPTTEIHTHNTRFSTNSLVLPRVYGIGQSTFVYTAIQAWNGLPIELRNIGTFESFKPKLKTYLMGKVNKEEISEYIWS